MSHSERHDRALLLHGFKRTAVLTLAEVTQYGTDSFGDPDYLRLYGMPPSEWYARGIRVLGRTSVECTRDALADRIGRDIASVAARRPSDAPITAVDPFAGSCNTLYWILRHVPNASGVACESDPQVRALSRRNIERLHLPITLLEGDYGSVLATLEISGDRDLIAFVAPPWGNALDEARGLDLRSTEPPIIEIIRHIALTNRGRRIIFAVQVYEQLDQAPVEELRGYLDWSDMRIYDLGFQGRNHGILLGTKGWSP